MRDLIRIAVVALLFIGPLPLQAQATPWTPEQRAIVALIHETAEANNAGDVQAWVSLFADDFVYLPPASPAVSTREALVEIAEAGFRHQADISIDPVEVQVIGSWAFARTRVTGTVTVNPSGEVITVDSKQIVIYRRVDSGAWRIARLISNSNS